MKRQSWDQYFMQLAQKASTRATCDRLHVGCVLVKERHIVASGYNGSVSGTPHCDDVGHDLQEGHCVRTVHAEMNALCAAAKNGVCVRDTTIYITHYPCWLCFKLLAQSGVERIVYGQRYRLDSRVEETAALKGIVLEELKDDA